MDEVGFLAVNMRKALTKAYNMDLDVFLNIMHDGKETPYTIGRWNSMQRTFFNWYLRLTNNQASKFCYWVLYSEDE